MFRKKNGRKNTNRLKPHHPTVCFYELEIKAWRRKASYSRSWTISVKKLNGGWNGNLSWRGFQGKTFQHQANEWVSFPPTLTLHPDTFNCFFGSLSSCLVRGKDNYTQSERPNISEPLKCANKKLVMMRNTRMKNHQVPGVYMLALTLGCEYAFLCLLSLVPCLPDCTELWHQMASGCFYLSDTSIQ